MDRGVAPGRDLAVLLNGCAKGGHNSREGKERLKRACACVCVCVRVCVRVCERKREKEREREREWVMLEATQQSMGKVTK